MSHQPSGNTRVVPSRTPLAIWLLSLLLLPPACTTDRSLPASAWPPDDFHLDVGYQGLRDGNPVSRRFQVWADGMAVYRRSRSVVSRPDSPITLPVYSAVSAYRMLPEATRSLSRKVWRRSDVLARATGRKPEGAEQPATGPLPTDPQPEPTDLTEQVRFECRAMGDVRSGIAAGQAFGSFALVLQVVNQYVPPGEEFRLPGMTTATDESVLMDVPRPREDAAAALGFHQQLLLRFPDDLQLLQDAFALACSNGDRAAAEELLARYRQAVERLPPGPGEAGGDVRPPLPEELAVFLPP